MVIQQPQRDKMEAGTCIGQTRSRFSFCLRVTYCYSHHPNWHGYYSVLLIKVKAEKQHLLTVIMPCHSTGNMKAM